MNFKFAAVSLVALGLFAGPVLAQDSNAPAEEQPSTEQAPNAVPEAIVALLNDRRSSQELSDDELKQRAREARGLLKQEGLPDDIRGQLQALIDSDRAELENRAAAANKPEEKPAEQPVQEAAPEPQPEKKKKAEPEPVQEAAPQPAEIPAEVTELLNDGRAIDQLSDDELKARARLARQQSKNEALPQDVREKLAAIGKEARQALAGREKKPEEKKPEEQAVQPEQPAPQPEQPVQEATPEPAPQPEQPVVNEQPQSAEQPPPAPPPAEKADVKELDANAGDPEAEKRALVFLEDGTSADALSDEDLRKRLDGMRDLMAENELSVKTERALRKKLRDEREVLRGRVAKAKAEEEAKIAAAQAAQPAPEANANADQTAPPPRKKKKFNINIIINADTPRREVLADRRAAEEMDDSELRYRRRAWREFQASDEFSTWDAEEIETWRERDRRDRDYLRGRLEEDRRFRRVELEKPANIRRIVIDDSERFSDDDVPSDVFAAEVDDEEIERTILAPPRRKFTRKIAVEEIARQPKVREALNRIEVDTIRFGFNEAFVREEEVDALDQIASVIERVLKKYPREVFLIEGHTDAVGADAYNDKLSKARAEAVKKALAAYYIIPARNLKTIGLGERYLKIPTAEAEPENRRVSISRATSVVGEAEEE